MAQPLVEVLDQVEQILRNAFSLTKLNRVPGISQINPLLHTHDPSRSLSIYDESDVANNLAFLAAVTDDPSQVMAVCVEERPDYQGMIIRIATNTGELLDVKTGFENIANVLEITTRRENSRPEDQRAMFKCIIALDYKRILVRLRSHHGESLKSTKVRPELIEQLRKALRDRTIQVTGLLRIRIESLGLLYDHLEKLSTIDPADSNLQDLLMNIIQQAFGLADDGDLSRALQQSRTLNPDLKTYLPEALRKIGRYYSISQDLVSAARRKRQMFCKIKVDIVQLDPFPPLGGRCRVHAEIQILFFYENNPQCTQPRVIASSKSACYLCNLFFMIHGRICIPSTHGRLYPRWTLPDWTQSVKPERHRELLNIIDRVNRALQTEIARSRASRRRAVKPPNESQLFVRRQWSLSTVSIHQTRGSELSIPAKTEHSAEPHHQDLDAVTDAIEPDTPQEQLLSNSSEESESTSDSAHDLVTSPFPSDDISPKSPLPVSASTSKKSGAPSVESGSVSACTNNSVAPAAKDPYVFLERGTLMRQCLGVDGVFRLSTDSIHATLAHQGCPAGSQKCLQECWVQIRWLFPTDEVDADLRSISLKTLSVEDSCLPAATPEKPSLYITNKRDVILLEFYHGPDMNENIGL